MNSRGSVHNASVQSNSVSAQFTALSRDRDKFRDAKEAAESAYRQLQQRIGNLKKEQVAHSTNIQKAQEALGNLNSKEGMHIAEHKRIARVTDCERKALEDCANHTQWLTKKEEDVKRQFCSDLGKINEDMADILQGRVNHRISSLLSVETLEGPSLAILSKRISQPVFREGLGEVTESKEAIAKEDARRVELNAQLVNARKAFEDEIIEMETETGMKRLTQMDLFYGPDSNDQARCA